MYRKFFSSFKITNLLTLKFKQHHILVNNKQKQLLQLMILKRFLEYQQKIKWECQFFFLLKNKICFFHPIFFRFEFLKFLQNVILFKFLMQNRQLRNYYLQNYQVFRILYYKRQFNQQMVLNCVTRRLFIQFFIIY
ncbi:unnamed protein product [Paramecium primaurelia]|uniref:Uncharacterized protein n=1 Tax=Paramecium primaurelia TaxID=5886 RepID=A0A8S1M3Y2_PARPR|nr:unnamed protein product [Paramecium primaurelia]